MIYKGEEIIPIGKIYFKAMVEKLANVTIIEMENEVKINAIDVQKELMKSKVMAKFSHYEKGKLFYTVELESGVYQFPINTIEKHKMLEDNLYILPEGLGGEDGADFKMVAQTEIEIIQLSEDLGSTKFFNETKGSELFRWIKKAISNDDFMKIS